MRAVCLIAASILWLLHALHVHSDNFSLVWCGASLIVLGYALDGAPMPWRKA